MTAPVPAEVLMSAAEAAAITDEFKATVKEFEGVGARVQDVALRAHNGGAWKVRGHDSWGEYVEAEVGWSKRHANRMVRYAQVVGEIAAASGTQGPTLSERDLRALGPAGQKAVTAEVAEKTKGQRKAKREKIVEEVVGQAVAAAKDEAKSWDVRKHLTAAQAIEVASLAASAGLDPAAFIAKTVAGLLETGEVPTFPTNGAPRINVARDLTRREVQPMFKGSGKK